MVTRPERKSDYDEIYSLVKAAFETSPYADGDEQDFVVKLRASGGYLPELALVTEKDGRLVGHIMLTKTYIDTEAGKIEALMLAPLAVLKEYRNKGLGAALVNTSLEKAKKSGYKAVFLCGDPDYYGRFGFKSVINWQLAYTMKNIEAKYVLA